MREQLQGIYNERDRFYGVFIRFGTKNGYKHTETTVLLTHITDKNGKELTDHLWFNFTQEFEKLWVKENLHVGHIISFNARVKEYFKGYGDNHRHEMDYKLSHPRKLHIEGKNSELWGLTNCDPPYELKRRQMIDDYKLKSYKQQTLIQENPLINADMKDVIKKPHNLDIFFLDK